MVVPLFWSNFLVQVHELPTGLMSETMARQFGDFLGQLLEYDMKSLNKGYGGYMRIRNIDPNRDLREEDCPIEIGEGKKRRLWHVLRETNPDAAFFLEAKIEKIKRSWDMIVGIDVSSDGTRKDYL
ncbi:hypothetical protein Goarm_015043 [Gossypium armourianum]|uniref:Uncharacterized protein n=1 Tax=Gossypium armourianum TaxID=34283 RepID=A0A7J9J7Y3_9ROSI|nr:hypothetical protein [Gossypium armourianum]